MLGADIKGSNVLVLGNRLDLLGLLKGALWVLNDLLETAALGLGSVLDLVDNSVALKAGLVHENTAGLGCANTEEEEVDRGKAREWG